MLRKLLTHSGGAGSFACGLLVSGLWLRATRTVGLAGAVLLAGSAAAAEAPKKVEPRIASIFPLTGQQGQTYTATIRGTSLADGHTLFFRDKRISGRILQVENEPDPTSGSSKNPVQRAEVEITVDKTAEPGRHMFGYITAEGLSNEIPLRIAAQTVTVEQDGTRDLPGGPVVVAGRISQSGEADDYWIDVQAGQALTFEVASGSPLLDPSVALYEPSGSWFDASRLNRIAFNDEAVAYPGVSKDPKLSHKFKKAGRYCVRVQGFAGQGSPDAVYELRITPGAEDPPSLRPVLRAGWEEHELTRQLTREWMGQVALRGAQPEAPPPPETYHAVPMDAADAPVMKVAGMVEGVIARPGEWHQIKLNVEKAQELAIEIETPKATMPEFTPVVTLLEPGGTEIVGNVYTRLNNNNLKMMKAIKAKTTFSLVAPGIYTLLIHELTTDGAGEDFQYRVLVRPQIPHLGKFTVAQDRINLSRGGSRPVSVRMDREEGFTGTVAVQVENLPSGVTALTGIENPPERPTLPNAGKPERYQPKVQATSVVLAAAADAPVSDQPAYIRLVARPVSEGRLGEPIASAEIPVVILGGSDKE